MRLLDGIQSALAPRSDVAAGIASLAWWLFAGAAVIFVAVFALTWLAASSRPRWLATERAIVVLGVVVPVLALAVLLVGSLSIAAAGARPASLRIGIEGHQWWWRVRYLDAHGALLFETANELRVPVGVPLEITLASADVLHSFWVPNLAGKLDLVPGRVNRLRLVVNTPGTFRGQCAEYCGGQHAHMGLYVVALAPDEFERWRARQRQPAAHANATFAARCSACHTIRGTSAQGTRGPDLTHIGSRLAIGAALLPRNTGTLAAWIATNQHLKPGNLMPSFADLGTDELMALARYLDALD
jgi:cytochrome c oxidase subunit 2